MHENITNNVLIKNIAQKLLKNILRILGGKVSKFEMSEDN